jgi:MFS family permease
VNGKSSTPPGRRALQSLNFFMADMQAGVGPFLGVFLLAHGWQSGWIGSVMTIGGVAGVLMTVPAGAWVDSSHRKRWLVAIPGLCTMFASAVILLSQSFWPVALSQVATAIAGAAVGPAVVGITLGMFRQAGFNRQNGVNQAYNHAGNAMGAGLSGLLGWQFGLPAVFYLAVIFAIASIVAVFSIPRSSIDDRVARGLEPQGEWQEEVRGLSVLLRCKPLLVLAACLAFFHLGNAAMLPLYGLAVVGAKEANPAAFVAATIVVAQATMVLTALIAMQMSQKRGLWWVMLVSFAALPVRGLIAAYVIESWGVFPVQILDGIGAGLQSVAVPALVARILRDTGRVNVGQGAVMTVQGVGASLSPAIGGWLAQWHGYGPAFLILGAFAIGSVVIWSLFASTLRPACSNSSVVGADAYPAELKAGHSRLLICGTQLGPNRNGRQW